MRFSTALLCILINALIFSRAIADDKVNQSMMCGVNSIYISNHLLNVGDLDYIRIMKAFPQCRTDGVSLKQICEYYEGVGLKCDIFYTNESKIINTKENASFFVLTKKNGLAHIVLKKSRYKSNVAVYDFPYAIKEKTYGELDDHMNLTLIVSNEGVSHWALVVKSLLISFVVFSVCLVYKFRFKSKVVK
jgi:hypothetical protein